MRNSLPTRFQIALFDYSISLLETDIFLGFTTKRYRVPLGVWRSAR